MPYELHKILIGCRDADFEKRMKKLRSALAQAARFADYGSSENQQVVEILRDVADHGDKAVAKYTAEFDEIKLKPGQFRVDEEDLEKARRELDNDIMASMRQAIDNVWAYQRDILINRDEVPRGIKYTPIRRIGICVPGASAPLPSTVIMTAVPAQVAGVKEIAVVSPPRYGGSIHPVILAVCCELGISEVYRIGGAQAVAALAAGTETIGKVDMIVGPGNKWVQSAKKNVSGDYVGIDSIAGPSEVLIIANEPVHKPYRTPSNTMVSDNPPTGMSIWPSVSSDIRVASPRRILSSCLNHFSISVASHLSSHGHSVKTLSRLATSATTQV